MIIKPFYERFFGYFYIKIPDIRRYVIINYFAVFSIFNFHQNEMVCVHLSFFYRLNHDYLLRSNLLRRPLPFCSLRKCSQFLYNLRMCQFLHHIHRNKCRKSTFRNTYYTPTPITLCISSKSF